MLQGVTRPSDPTVKASPGSVPEPGVGTTSTSSTSLAVTLRVAAPVGFWSHALPSLTRIDWRAFVGTSLNEISQRSAPTAVMSIRANWRQPGWMWVRPTSCTHACADGGRSVRGEVDAR